MGITEIVSSVLGGGLTGLLGAIITKVAEYKTKQLDIKLLEQKSAHELAMKKADAQLMAQEWAARTQVAQIEADGRESVADAQAFAASFNEPSRYSEDVKPSPGQAWMLVTLDFIRGFVRPGLTVYLCVLTTLIYLHARSLLGAGISADQAVGIVKDVIDTVLYLSTTCLLWWFGVRNKQRGK